MAKMKMCKILHSSPAFGFVFALEPATYWNRQHTKTHLTVLAHPASISGAPVMCQSSCQMQRKQRGGWYSSLTEVWMASSILEIIFYQMKLPTFGCKVRMLV